MLLTEFAYRWLCGESVGSLQVSCEGFVRATTQLDYMPASYVELFAYLF
jgi:hypothetical protein